MKEQDVLSDYEPHQLVLYAEKRDGSYGPVQTGSWLVKNYLDDYREKRERLKASGLERIARGEISPLRFHLDLAEMSPEGLARRAGVAAWRVRRHLEPRAFGRIGLPLLRRYADALGIPVAAFLALPAHGAEGEAVAFEPSGDPIVSVLKVRS